MPRSRLVDFDKFHYNLKVTRGGHEFRHESTGTRAQGTKAQVLDMLCLHGIDFEKTQSRNTHSSHKDNRCIIAYFSFFSQLKFWGWAKVF